MAVLDTLQVSPQDIRFTQDSISEEFGVRGPSHTIEDTFKKLLYGDLSVNTPRTISVVRKDGLMWVVSGNRRLYVYKKLQDYGRIKTMTVNVVAFNKEQHGNKFTTKNEGKSIRIRQDKERQKGETLEDRLHNIHREWVTGSFNDSSKWPPL